MAIRRIFVLFVLLYSSLDALTPLINLNLSFVVLKTDSAQRPKSLITTLCTTSYLFSRRKEFSKTFFTCLWRTVFIHCPPHLLHIISPSLYHFHTSLLVEAWTILEVIIDLACKRLLSLSSITHYYERYGGY